MSPATTAAPAARRDPSARSVTFRFSLELYDRLAAFADEDHRTLNAAANLLLAEALDQRSSATAAKAAELKELRRAARVAKAAGLIEPKTTRRKAST